MSNPFDDDGKYCFAISNLFTHLEPIKSYTKKAKSNEDEVEDYEREIERLMQETLSSTQRSGQHLESAEKHGTDTARNLLEQREKLERTEKNLDEINYTTQQTQRSLNSLKSVFGGFFKNKFSRAPQKPQNEVNNWFLY
jgi:synaptosomal-associated protein 29